MEKDKNGQDQNGASTGDGAPNADTGGQEGGSGKVFTQEEVNAIIAQRRERAKVSWAKELPDL